MQKNVIPYDWHENVTTITAQKMKFSIKNFFSKCDQIHRKLRTRAHLLKKSLMEYFIFCAAIRMWLEYHYISPAIISDYELDELLNFWKALLLKRQFALVILNKKSMKLISNWEHHVSV